MKPNAWKQTLLLFSLDGFNSVCCVNLNQTRLRKQEVFLHVLSSTSVTLFNVWMFVHACTGVCGLFVDVYFVVVMCTQPINHRVFQSQNKHRLKHKAITLNCLTACSTAIGIF